MHNGNVKDFPENTPSKYAVGLLEMDIYPPEDNGIITDRPLLLKEMLSTPPEKRQGD